VTLLEELQVLAAEVGTPTQVYDEAAVVERFAALAPALGVDRLLYAVKCNPHRRLLATLVRLGCSFEIVAESELLALRELGCSAERIVYAHPIRRPIDLQVAHRHGLRTFVVDEIAAFAMLEATLPDFRCLLRVRAAGASPRYGMSAAEACSALVHSPVLRTKTIGVCMHHGPYESPAEVAVFVSGLAAIREVCAAAGADWRVVDVGGGYPDTLHAHDPVFAACTAAIAEARRSWASRFEVWAEPGRSLAGPAFHLVMNVQARRVHDGVVHYYVDDSVYGSYLDAATMKRKYNFTALGSGEARPSVLFGATCDSVDIIARDVQLPLLEVGDFIYCIQAGAYTTSLTTGFNGIRRPVGARRLEEKAK
jgi:ornithine decarboxylase